MTNFPSPESERPREPILEHPVRRRAADRVRDSGRGLSETGSTVDDGPAPGDQRVRSIDRLFVSTGPWAVCRSACFHQQRDCVVVVEKRNDRLRLPSSRRHEITLAA